MSREDFRRLLTGQIDGVEYVRRLEASQRDPFPGVYGRFDECAKKVLELALREALSLGHNYIGTEHILLGLLRQKDTIAVSALGNVAHCGAIRNEVIRLLTRQASA